MKKASLHHLLIHYLTAPSSRMDVISDAEKKEVLRNSDIMKDYDEVIDRDSAYEMLSKKMEAAEKIAEEEKEEKAAPKSRRRSTTKKKPLINTTTKNMIIREVTRGLLGVLGISSTRKRKKTGLFGF